MSAFHAYPTFVDGVIHAAGAGVLSTDDQGFQSGLSVFETLLFEDGCIYDVEEHLARLADGARAIGIGWPLARDPERALREYVDALGARDVALRLTLTRGVPGRAPALVVGARDLVRPPAEGVVVVVDRSATVRASTIGSIKSTNRLQHVLAREAAQREGAFEALFCTDDGDVSEGTISNVFAEIRGVIVTPGVDRGCLPGIQRGHILGELERSGAAVRVDRLELTDLAHASEVFLSNTTGRVIPVIEVRGVAVRLPGAAGPRASELRERLRIREERYRAANRR
jgi:branched-chain amino acid aminotransferase